MNRGRAPLAILVFATGCLAIAGCHDFSKIKPGRDIGDGGPDTDAAPDTATCSGLVVTKIEGTTSCAQIPQSCQLLPANCGPDGNDNCCQYSPQIGNDPSDLTETFSRGYDRSLPTGTVAPDTVTQNGVTIHGAEGLNAAPARLDPYYLERYEVTIGRFRWFYNNYGAVNNDWARQGVGEYPPANTKNGWDPSWTGNANLYAQNQGKNGETDGLLTLIAPCNGDLPTWLTSATSAHDNEPMSCVTWYEAFLFCYADGNGHLPAEAEWNFAAAGGTEGRPYPWTQPTDASATLLEIPAMYANVGGIGPGTVQAVGTYSKPGKWGHYDLAGNVWEYVLDGCIAPGDQYADMGTVVMDPMTLFDATTYNSGVVRGGSYLSSYTAPFARTSYRMPFSRTPRALRDNNTGFRCARDQQAQ